MNSNSTLSDDALKPLMGDWLQTRAQDHPDDVATVDLAVKGFDTERQPPTAKCMTAQGVSHPC